MAVVGAGPAGATAAYFLAGAVERRRPRGMSVCGAAPQWGIEQGHRPLRVALLEKERFPRDKICGDAWCAPALDILDEMGVLQPLEDAGLFRDTRAGGFISPAGESFVAGAGSPGAPGTRVYAIKRIICDERIARRAVEAGAELYEEASVGGASLGGDGVWTVDCRDGRSFHSRMLLCADGAASPLARKLGLLSAPATAAAARRYVKGGTHNFKADGVLFYPSFVLPGYIAVFRHFDDDLDLGCYILPGGEVSPSDLKRIYHDRILRDPYVAAVLGKSAEFREQVRIAPIRLGGEKRSYGERCLVLGDAAGQTDPLTGEGIHTAMIAAKLAARTVHELFAAGDFSERACSIYQQRWMRAFGHEFRASALGARAVRRYPLLLDAAAVVAQRKGDAFMQEFGAAMTGVCPKTTFLRPSVAAPLLLESCRQLLGGRRQGPAGTGPSPSAPLAQAASVRCRERYEAGVRAGQGRRSAFRNACLVDAGIL